MKLSSFSQTLRANQTNQMVVYNPLNNPCTNCTFLKVKTNTKSLTFKAFSLTYCTHSFAKMLESIKQQIFDLSFFFQQELASTVF